MPFCDICGDTLKEDEVEREIKGKQVCHDCLYDGLKLLREKVGELKHEGRDRLDSKQNMEEAEAAAKEAEAQEAGTADEDVEKEDGDTSKTEEESVVSSNVNE